IAAEGELEQLPEAAAAVQGGGDVILAPAHDLVLIAPFPPVCGAVDGNGRAAAGPATEDHRALSRLVAQAVNRRVGGKRPVDFVDFQIGVRIVESRGGRVVLSVEVDRRADVPTEM